MKGNQEVVKRTKKRDDSSSSSSSLLVVVGTIGASKAYVRTIIKQQRRLTDSPIQWKGESQYIKSLTWVRGRGWIRERREVCCFVLVVVSFVSRRRKSSKLWRQIFTWFSRVIFFARFLPFLGYFGTAGVTQVTQITK